MNHQNETYLINGEFTPAEAREILVNLYQSKIQFHEMKSFSAMVQNGEKNEESAARIMELKAGLKHALHQIELAENSEQLLVIKSTIHIEKVKHEPATTD